MKENEIIGYISIDSGLILLSDPCRVIHNEEPHPDFGSGWLNFCNRIEAKDVIKIGDTTALVVGSFGGDGVYPVFVERDKRGLVVEVSVRFDRPQVNRSVSSGKRPIPSESDPDHDGSRGTNT